MRQKKIMELNLQNMDETGFQIGYKKAQLIVTIDPNKSLYMIDLENCNEITSVECIGSANETIPPMLLISGVNILHKCCQHNDLDSNVVIGITKTIYANNNTLLEQLQHFIDHTQNKRRGAWLLLIVGGYGPHMIISFHNLATENKIVLFCLPLYSTHLT